MGKGNPKEGIYLLFCQSQSYVCSDCLDLGSPGGFQTYTLKDYSKRISFQIRQIRACIYFNEPFIHTQKYKKNVHFIKSPLDPPKLAVWSLSLRHVDQQRCSLLHSLHPSLVGNRSGQVRLVTNQMIHLHLPAVNTIQPTLTSL